MLSSDQHASGSRSSDCARPAGAIIVRVRLQGKVPLAIIDRGPWTEPPLVIFRDDGTTEMKATTCDLDAASRWILERGTWAEALSPPPLRQRVAAQAWGIYCRYRSDGALMYEKER